MSVDISKIRRDGGTQSRAEINEETVTEYAEAMADPDTVFPPITVYFDGRDYWLADGFHRLAAWERIGRTDIPAEIRQGDRRRAILHSCSANAAHGLRRTNADKRRAVRTLLEDDEWAAWSDREIARRCRVSDHTVAKYRAEILGLTANLRSEQRTYTTKHGTTATMDTARIGKQPEDIPAERADLPSDDLAGGPGMDLAAHSGPTDTAEAATEATPDPHAKERRQLASLSREGLEDEVIGLREALAEEKAKLRDTKAKLKEARETIASHTADDKDEVIRRLSAEVKNHQRARFQAEEKFAAEKRKTFALNKRVKELESMGIPL